jgi:glutathionylspermidine synthase
MVSLDSFNPYHEKMARRFDFLYAPGRRKRASMAFLADLLLWRRRAKYI